MTHPSKRKGNSFEREIVTLLQDFGLSADRTYVSGMIKPNGFNHDIWCPVRGVDWKIECKHWANGVGGKTLHRLLTNVHAIIHRCDRQEPLVTLRFTDFLKLTK